MSLSILCPDCEAELHLPDDQLGKSAKCRVCGVSFTATGKVKRHEEKVPIETPPKNEQPAAKPVEHPAAPNEPRGEEKPAKDPNPAPPPRPRRETDFDRPRDRSSTQAQNQMMAAGGVVGAIVVGVVVWQVALTQFGDEPANNTPAYGQVKVTPSSPRELRAAERHDDPPAAMLEPDKAEPPAVEPNPPKSAPPAFVVEPKKFERPALPPPPKFEPPPPKESEFDKRLRAIKGTQPNRFDVGWFSSQPVEANRRAEVARALEGCLKSSDPWVGYDAAEALKRWGDADSVRPLVEYYHLMSEGSIRRRVVETLATIKDERSVKALIVMLKGQPDERRTVTDALRRMGNISEKEVRSLLDETDADLPLDACRILGGIGTKESLPALDRLIGRLKSQLNDGKWRNVHTEAGRAVAAIKARGV